MRKSILFTAVAILSTILLSTANAQSRKERKVLYNSNYNYEVTALGVGQDGTKVFKVWGYGKKVEDAIMNAKELGVAACIFKGLPGGAGSAPTPAIVTESNAEVKYAEYFETFFELGGKYMQYIVATGDGVPSGQDRLKIKKGYKVGLTVQISYDALRKQLEADGIARKLNAGF